MQHFGINKAMLKTPQFKRYYEYVGAGVLVIALTITGYLAITRSLEADRLRGALSAATSSNNDYSIKLADLNKQFQDFKASTAIEIENIANAKEDRLNAFALQAQKCEAIKKKLGIKG